RHAGPLAPVISALLAKSPEARPSGARLRGLLQVAEAGVQAGVATEPQPATQPLPPPSMGWPTRRRADRRPLWIVGGTLLALLVALVVALWQSGVLTGPETKPPARGGTASGASGAGSNAAQGQRSAPTTTQPGPSASSQPQGSDSGAGSAAATGNTQAATATPVTLPTSEQPAPGQLLPKFWTSATNQAGGYSVGVPQTWDVSATGTTTDVEWLGERTFEAAFQVQALPQTQAPLQWLKGQAATFATDHQSDSYTQLKLTSHWNYKGQPAAAWEFTWFRNGEKTHARWVAFRSGSHTFAVLYRSRDVFWLGGGSAVFPEGFEQAFTPLG
ncbi:MAG TPA: hypothetical protein VF995_08215, partial [Actinomycetota bacterium]